MQFAFRRKLLVGLIAVGLECMPLRGFAAVLALR
jgi:hypothetical protein